jgi:hypothetical protein
MKMFVKTATMTLAALVGATSLALAQTPPPAPAPSTPPAATVPSKPTPPATAKKGTPPPKKATTPEGQVCSAEADKYGLRGRERRNYRSRCIKAVKKGQPPPPVTPVRAAPKAAPKAAAPAPAPAAAPKN